MEDLLIQQLTLGESQWIYRDDLKTEDQLWNNLKSKLEQNNIDILSNVLITDQEMSQIKNQLSFSSFYEASRWFVGENGIAKIRVQREDAKLGTIYLKAFSRADIAGGMSSYEVINQFQSSKKEPLDRERRFDISLLINGIPVIHIELKNRSHPYKEAFNQVRKYLVQGRFTGIFSAIQMFVLSNGSDTRYIASSSSSKLNEKFLTAWVDKDNIPVNDYIAFARDVLSIPQAHKMVTQYTVIDSNSKNLILLRPYQIHAIEAVKESSRKGKSGHVWHTTGSGKTLTSYKVARNLLQIASIDKTIFIVDRIDLDQQTTSSFTAYSENDIVEIDETDNVKDLIAKLLSDDRTVIITTIQKLNYVMKRFEGKEDSTRYKKLSSIRLAFVVDECHRAVSPKKQLEIEKFFKNSLWYGFTGTPIFAENAKQILGNLARTTKEQYGNSLHEYTVKDAIHDSAVLGFQIEYKSTIPDYELDSLIGKIYPSLDPTNMSLIEKERKIPHTFFEDDRHLKEVVHSIVNKSYQKLGIGNGVGKTYSSILTTSSISLAQKYYKLFKDISLGTSDIKVNEKIKSVLPDFPKVAITYSVSENEEASISNQEEISKSICDYNKTFKTDYSLETIKAYNRNVNDRLARKKEKYLFREEQIDIVIVVDRLLTGFDAPCLSTLFIDRPPMSSHNLIQAFSRTNRLFDRPKKYGQIVTFQTPSIFEEKVRDALVLYSNGGESDVLAPSFEDIRLSFIKAIKELREIAPTPNIIDSFINNGQKRKFAKYFQTFDKAFTSISVYSDFDRSQLESVYYINEAEIEEYSGKYNNIIEELRVPADPDDPVEAFDIEYELESVKTDEINYEYILMLIQAFVPSSSDKDYKLTIPSEQELSEIDDYISSLEKANPKLASIMKELWSNIKDNPNDFLDQDISVVLEGMINRTIQTLINDFSKKWSVNESELIFLVSNFNKNREKQIGEAELKRTSDYENYKTSIDNPVRKLTYWRTVKEAYTEMIHNDILPLRRF